MGDTLRDRIEQSVLHLKSTTINVDECVDRIMVDVEGAMRKSKR